MPQADHPADEFALIERFLKGLDEGVAIALGNGDDGAVLDLADDEQLVVSVDSMVGAVHFPSDSPAERIAYRAVGAAASDLAAMGARPVAMTLALTLPQSDEQWLAAFRRGLARAVDAFSLPLVGGDLTRGPLNLSVQVMGAVARSGALRRDGARPGDAVYVSGTLGDSAAGLAVVQDRLAGEEGARLRLAERFWCPEPELALGPRLVGIATAAIDVSDGLLADAAHIAVASGVGVRIDSGSLPLSGALLACCSRDQAIDWALGGGEDYRLCFTLPESIDAPDGCVQIGVVEAGNGVTCDRPVSVQGFRHFA